MSDKNLYSAFDNIEVPNSLLPENIEEALKGKKRKKNTVLITSLCLVLVAAVVSGVALWNSGRGFVQDGSLENAIIKASVPEEKKADYNDIFKKLKSAGLVGHAQNEDGGGSWLESIFGMVGGAKDEAIMENADGEMVNDQATTAASTAGGADDYYKGNMQVVGVEEPEVAKTDGEYIYAVSSKKLHIVKMNNGDMELVSSIELDADSEKEIYASNMFLMDGKVAVIARNYTAQEDESRDIAYWYGSNGKTEIYVFDVADKKSPKHVSTVGQDGDYIDARMVGENIFLITSQFVNGYAQEEDVSDYVPQTYSEGEASLVEPDCIVLPEVINGSNYLVVSSLSLSSPEEISSVQTVLGYSGTLYATPESIYMPTYVYEEEKEYSEIFRFSIADGTVEAAGSAKVNGSVLDQFSMDEKDGFLRVVSQEYWYDSNPERISGEMYQHVTVFNASMEQVGHTAVNTKNETLRSVRFDGDLCHFVTFENTDPLFTVDLSNPENPKILDALKIPGYSEYMHVYDTNILVGIGHDVNEETGEYLGAKISLFDSSDPENVKEISTLTFDVNDYYTSISHKEVIISKDKNLIGARYGSEYCVFEVKNNKVELKDKFTIPEYGYYSSDCKPFYAGEHIYIAYVTGICSYDLKTGDVESIILEESEYSDHIVEEYAIME